MRILMVAPQPPYPPAQGAAIRNWHLLQALATRHQVDLLCFGTGLPDPALGRVARQVVHVPPPRRSLAERVRTLLFSDEPDLLRRLESPAFVQAMRALVGQHCYDVIQIEGLELHRLVARALRGAGRPPAIVLDCHNVEYLLQQRAAAGALHSPQRWPLALYSLLQARRLRRHEARACAAASRVLSVSSADARALAALGASCPIVIPNCVDSRVLQPGRASEVPGRVVFA